MQVKAIYNKGQLELPADTVLRKDVFQVKVEIPDEILVNSQAKGSAEKPGTRSGKFSISTQLDEILGPDRGGQKDPSLHAGEYKRIWDEHRKEKHLGRR
jgi:hypothetical protein